MGFCVICDRVYKIECDHNDKWGVLSGLSGKSTHDLNRQSYLKPTQVDK